MSTYAFPVDYVLQIADGRNPLELAQFIDENGDSLTCWEIGFIEKILSEGLVQISPRQFATLVKIYDERV